MLRKAIVLTVVNVIGRAINFILFLIIANKFGANTDTDWFFLNYGIVYFFTGVLFNASENTLVPIWNSTKEEYHVYIFRKFAIYSCYIFLSTTAIIFFSATVISPLIGVAPPRTNTLHIIIICSIFSFQPILAFLSSLLSSYMQYERKYILPTFHLAIRSIGVLPIILFDYCATILCLSFSFLIGEILRFIVMKKKYFNKFFLGEKNPQNTIFMSDIARSTALMSLTLSLTVANPLVDLAMVGHLSDGSVSLVEYAGRLRGLPILGFNGILILLLGEWSKTHAQKNKGLTWKNVSNILLPSIFLSSIIVILLIFFINNWIFYIFSSKKFSYVEISALKDLLEMYFIGIPMLIGVSILTKVIIVYQRYRICVIITFAMFILNILLNIIFIKIFGLKGVAISTSTVDLLTLFLFFCATKIITASGNMPRTHII